MMEEERCGLRFCTCSFFKTGPVHRAVLSCTCPASDEVVLVQIEVILLVAIATSKQNARRLRRVQIVTRGKSRP